MNTYDSTPDTVNHIDKVRTRLSEVMHNLGNRAVMHDWTKLREPEKSGFDRAAFALKDLAYGSPEYKAALEDLKPTLAHHYAAHRHHIEHWENGWRDMTLLDLIELLADWKAATERMKDGDLGRSIEINRTRFDLSPDMALILFNTAEELGWLKKETP